MNESLYRQVIRARAYEVAVADLWTRGLISGEMHLGTGEEAVAAGVVSHLRDGDGLALTHRCSPQLVVRGVPLVAMLRELLGKADGLGGGRAGHMHLFSRDHLAGTSGIVGASLPMGAGFALAAALLRAGAIGVAFIGDGALNQGMALETLNLAVAWGLPLLVVCIDNKWAITTRSSDMSGGGPIERAAAFGWETTEADGTDVCEMFEVAGRVIKSLRRDRKPVFLLAHAPRLDGHFLGDPLLRMAKQPLDGGRKLLSDVASSLVKGGGGVLDRAGGMLRMGKLMVQARAGAERESRADPVRKARDAMKHTAQVRDSIEREVSLEIERAVAEALRDMPESGDA